MTWRFFVPLRLPSLNDHVQNAGSARWQYKREREQWCLAIRVVSRKVPIATGKRSLVVRRVFSGRERERDYVNLVGGCKVVVDALVLEGLLVDDRPALLADRYEQVRVSGGQESGVWFELADAPANSAQISGPQRAASRSR